MDIRIRNIFNTIYSREVEYRGTVDILLQACPNHILEDHHKVVVLRSNLCILCEHIFCLFGYHKLMHGADLVNHSTKVIIELKNSEKSDNVSSKKANMKKLIKTRFDFTDKYTLVYGMVNDREPRDKTIKYHGVDVRLLTGKYLLQFVMGDKYEETIQILQNVFRDYFSDTKWRSGNTLKFN